MKDGKNWYSYCKNDPANRIDLWGLDEKIPILKTGDTDGDVGDDRIVIDKINKIDLNPAPVLKTSELKNEFQLKTKDTDGDVGDDRIVIDKNNKTDLGEKIVNIKDAVVNEANNFVTALKEDPVYYVECFFIGAIMGLAYATGVGEAATISASLDVAVSNIVTTIATYGSAIVTTTAKAYEYSKEQVFSFATSPTAQSFLNPNWWSIQDNPIDRAWGMLAQTTVNSTVALLTPTQAVDFNFFSIPGVITSEYLNNTNYSGSILPGFIGSQYLNNTNYNGNKQNNNDKNS